MAVSLWALPCLGVGIPTVPEPPPPQPWGWGKPRWPQGPDTARRPRAPPGRGPLPEDQNRGGHHASGTESRRAARWWRECQDALGGPGTGGAANRRGGQGGVSGGGGSLPGEAGTQQVTGGETETQRHPETRRDAEPRPCGRRVAPESRALRLPPPASLSLRPRFPHRSATPEREARGPGRRGRRRRSGVRSLLARRPKPRGVCPRVCAV